MFLFIIWIGESWLTPFQVSSDVVALRFLLFLSQVYGAVLLLTPLLIAVELLVHLLRSSEDKKEESTLSRTTGFLGCLLVWIASGIYSSNGGKLGQIETESCLDRTACLISCLPGFATSPSAGTEELSWILPAVVLLLSLTGGLGLLETKSPNAHSPNTTCTRLTGAQPKKPPLYRAGFGLENVTLLSYQTGLAPQQSLSTSRALFLQPNTKLVLEMSSPEDHKAEQCHFKKTEPVVKETPERESPGLGGEMFRGLLCAVLVCVFPTVVSGNVLVILNLETLVVHTLKLLSRRAQRTHHVTHKH